MPTLEEDSSNSQLEEILAKAKASGSDTEKLGKILVSAVEYGVSPKILKDIAPTPSSKAIAKAINQLYYSSQSFRKFIDNTKIYCTDLQSIQTLQSNQESTESQSPHPIVYLLDHNSLNMMCAIV